MASLLLLSSCLMVLAVYTTTTPALAAGFSAPPKPQPSPPAHPSGEEPFLTAHNTARAAVGVAPLTWSPKLAGDAVKFAQDQKDHQHCGFVDMGASPYGINEAIANYAANPAEVVASWVAEKKYYDHATNTCAEGHDCGTYTQVVWRKTLELGCAQAICGRERATLTLCLYFPHGNVQGQSPY